jgi:flagellar biogenesis protein FliO|tara:strand:- start:1855 stop:2028 length:174 start_codon:yes stop_codon:yes gene_type:complete
MEWKPIFGIDIETFNTMWLSLLVVIMVIGVMTWALVRMMQLMNHRDADGSKQNRITL